MLKSLGEDPGSWPHERSEESGPFAPRPDPRVKPRVKTGRRPFLFGPGGAPASHPARARSAASTPGHWAARARTAATNHCGARCASASTLTSDRQRLDRPAFVGARDQPLRVLVGDDAGRPQLPDDIVGDQFDEQLRPFRRVAHPGAGDGEQFVRGFPASPRHRRTLPAAATRRPGRSPCGRGSSR